MDFYECSTFMILALHIHVCNVEFYFLQNVTNYGLSLHICNVTIFAVTCNQNMKLIKRRIESLTKSFDKLDTNIRNLGNINSG